MKQAINDHSPTSASRRSNQSRAAYSVMPDWASIEYLRYDNAFTRRWTAFFVRRAHRGWSGRVAAHLAVLFARTGKSRVPLSGISAQGFISPRTRLDHQALEMGRGVFIDERVHLYQNTDGGALCLGDNTCVFEGCTIETGFGGRFSLGRHSSLQSHCRMNAYLADIYIGQQVIIAPNCAFYSYNHGVAPGPHPNEQPLESSGPIVVEDGAWIGHGVTVVAGVTIGEGAVVGAGSVVTRSIPARAIAVGSPAKVVAMRE